MGYALDPWLRPAQVTPNMKYFLKILFLFLLATSAIFSASPLRASTEQDVKIGNYLVSAPYGIIADDR